MSIYNHFEEWDLNKKKFVTKVLEDSVTKAGTYIQMIVALTPIIF